MKRQQIRKLLLTISFLLFPITLFYFSPALIINAALSGIINGSFIVFLLLFILSIPFSRLYCAYLCPAGGLQACSASINGKLPKQGWRNYIKYVIFSIWIGVIIACYFIKGSITGVDFFFETTHGISVTSVQSYVIYYGIVILIFLPSVLFGKQLFCHYFCWMAPFMVIGIKLRDFLHIPGLRVGVKKGSDCISCGRCNQQCPMGLNVKEMVKGKAITHTECIQCGACIDICPKDVLKYEMKARTR